MYPCIVCKLLPCKCNIAFKPFSILNNQQNSPSSNRNAFWNNQTQQHTSGSFSGAAERRQHIKLQSSLAFSLPNIHKGSFSGAAEMGLRQQSIKLDSSLAIPPLAFSLQNTHKGSFTRAAEMGLTQQATKLESHLAIPWLAASLPKTHKGSLSGAIEMGLRSEGIKLQPPMAGCLSNTHKGSFSGAAEMRLRQQGIKLEPPLAIPPLRFSLPNTHKGSFNGTVEMGLKQQGNKLESNTYKGYFYGAAGKGILQHKNISFQSQIAPPWPHTNHRESFCGAAGNGILQNQNDITLQPELPPHVIHTGSFCVAPGKEILQNQNDIAMQPQVPPPRQHINHRGKEILQNQNDIALQPQVSPPRQHINHRGSRKDERVKSRAKYQRILQSRSRKSNINDKVMAAAVDKSEMRLEFGRVPVIDMQYFSQDEINTAARSSDVYCFDDLAIPNIDYSIFNESTGSSNQTYTNQILLQCKEERAGQARRRAGHLSVSRRQNVLTENEKKQVHWVLELIKEFRIKGEHFRKNSVLTTTNSNTAFGVHNLASNQENSNLEAGSSLQLLTDPALQTIDDAKLASNTLNSDRSIAITNTGLDKAKKRIKTKEGARRKPFMTCNETGNDQMVLKIARSNAAESTGYLTHGFSKAHESSDDKAAKEDIGAPANNVGSTFGSPHTSNEPQVPQFKRKVKPLATEAELQDYFNSIGGEWASNMKRRKIVDAEDFAEGFPKGWKLLLGVRKKHGKFIIECRKYISPEGLQFASCRDVTTYLSNTGNSSAAVVTAQENSNLEESNDAHQNAIAGTSAEENMMTGSQVMQPAEGGTMLTGGLSTENNAEKNSPDFDNSATPEMEPPPKMCQGDSSSGTLDIVGDSKKRQNATNQNHPMNCKKCNGSFSNRSEFMGHLSIHHVKKKKVVADKTTIADGAILVNGKYECQICHKVFDERNRYTGHVGVHSRKNVKRARDGLDQTENETKAALDFGDGGVRAKQNIKRPRVSLDQTGTETKADLNGKKISDDKQELQIKAEHFQEILEAKIFKEQNNTANSYLAFLGAVGNGLASPSIGGFLGGLDSDSGKDQANFTAGNEKFDDIADFEKIHMYNSVPKFSFEAGQDAIDADLSYGDVLQQVEMAPGQFGWDSFLSGRENSSQFVVCVWCNEEFIYNGVDQDQQADSVGVICPNCKTKDVSTG
ncbi:uncharacterized protein LOC131044822 isoform X3 [Cryptomeria japonica]|uniref:uncharacterized protein LOC131044822 isoform X3 n=1 Tax=Cryptomeria japonica TaxID=3369 RepID=UPI0025ABF8FB|nr:uncharacterized protein LOC131044822 isoform X3 [Cryptomeria japonica]